MVRSLNLVLSLYAVFTSFADGTSVHTTGSSGSGYVNHHHHPSTFGIYTNTSASTAQALSGPRVSDTRVYLPSGSFVSTQRKPDQSSSSSLNSRNIFEFPSGTDDALSRPTGTSTADSSASSSNSNDFSEASRHTDQTSLQPTVSSLPGSSVTTPSAPASAGQTGLAQLSATSTTSNYATAPFIVAGSITVPAQTALATGQFATITPTVTGPPNSYTVTTTSDASHNTAILPIWFKFDGTGLLVLPSLLSGLTGIIPPPPGLPRLQIGPDGQATESPDRPTSESGPSATSEPPESSTTSATSCTQSAVSSEIVSCVTTIFDGSSSSMSCTTQTKTITGCDVNAGTSTTISTSTASATPTRYMILAQPTASLSDQRVFEASLVEAMGKTNVQSATDGDSTVFWLATLNSTQVEEFQKNTVVISAVLPDKTLSIEGVTDTSEGSSNVKRDVPIAQLGSNDELRVLSQGRDNQGKPFDLKDIEYQYDPSAGKGITVYVVDTGANPDHIEYKTMPGSKRWMWPGFEGTVDKMDYDFDDKVGHGACVLSKVSGPNVGVAKNVDVVIVKPQDLNDITEANFAKTMMDIKADIVKHKLQDKAVINMSFGFNEQQLSNLAMRSTIENMFRGITSLGVPIIAAAGNNARLGRQVDTFPQLWADKNDGILVVGSVNNIGDVSYFSSPGKQVSIFAPGEAITCAASTGELNGISKQGTSYSAPAVAGLAAYILGGIADGTFGTGQQLAENINARLIQYAYERKAASGAKVAWNGLDGKTSCSGNLPRRDGSCSRSESNLASTTFATSITAVSISSTEAHSEALTSSTTTSQPSTSISGSSTTSMTASPTSSTVPSIAIGEPSCSPTGQSMEQARAQTKINWFCNNLIQNSPCKSGDSILLTNAAAGCIFQNATLLLSKILVVDGSITDGGSLMTLNASLSQGQSFAMNESTCNTAFSTVLNGCAPFTASDGQILAKYGGSIMLRKDDTAANLTIVPRPIVADDDTGANPTIISSLIIAE